MRGDLVLVSNDDGPDSPGLEALLGALRAGGLEATFVVPEGPRSASGMSLTFHKPVRAWDREIAGVRGYVISGSPADAVLLGTLRLVGARPCAVASGINMGENAGLQDLFASGTVAAAIQASLLGIPSAAFSLDIGEGGSRALAAASYYAAEVVRWICERGLPGGVDLLSVNFPSTLGAAPGAEVRLTRPARRKYENYVVERLDPRGHPYYWIWGKALEPYEEGTDVYAVKKEGAISITPLGLALSPPGIPEGLEELRRRLELLGRQGPGQPY